MSDIENDVRMPYFSHVATCTNVYASTSGGGIGLGHEWQSINVQELVTWTAVPIHHGALNGKQGTLFTRWNTNDSHYVTVIDASISMECWKNIKRYFKLNNNLTTPAQGMEGYDPCARYDFTYKFCLIVNMNYLTKKADKDRTINETTWGFSGYGTEAMYRMQGKKKDKGGQTMLLYDINHRYPHGYIHRHKLQPKPMGFNAQGPAEIYEMVKTIDAQTVHAPPSGREDVVVKNPTGIGTLQFQMKKVYPKPPHIVADNHFSGEEVMNLLGSKGYGATMTNRRDRFPEGLKPYLHHEGVKSAGCPKARAMRFDNPIVAIKQVPAVENEDGSIKANACTRTLVSFPSLGPTNICGVNNLPSVSLYVSKRVRRKGAATRMWGIKQNEARETYLCHY
jgi:hypothetical protein